MNSRSQIGGGDSSLIFKITSQELQDLFLRETPQPRRLDTLNQTHKGVDGILAKVQSERNSGIMGDAADLKRRQQKYCKNEKPRPVSPPFFDSVKDALNDRILMLVAVFAVISIIPGMVVSPKNGWVEGVFILIALFVQVLITAWNDHSKDEKFVTLQNLNREESLPVLRGKRGQLQTISVWKLVVGDIIQLQPGDKLPADCVVMSSANLQVQEPTRIENEGEPTRFEWSTLSKDAREAPFLFADSYILSGTCKALVCCVGQDSTRGIHDTVYDTRDQETELTRKLDNIGGSLKFIGLIGMFVILGTSLIVLFIQKGVDSNLEGDAFVKKLIDCIIVSLILLIVAIPEGLPMTVAVSLAYSVLQMSEDDNVLVRDLNSVEQVGQITDLCLGKTGTMTTEDMEVVSFYTQNMHVLNSRKNTFMNCDLDQNIIEKIVESIVFNSSAYIEMSKNSFYIPVGQGTEVSLIKWLQAAEIPVHEIMMQKYQEDVVLAQVPFNSKLKRSIIAVKHPQLQDTVRVYVKGAPEIVVKNCKQFYDKQDAVTADGERYQEAVKKPLDEMEKQRILNDFMEQKMTKLSHRAIAFSYCDMPSENFEHLMREMQGDIDDTHEIEALERDQVFLALVGLKDPVRDNIKKVVSKASEAGVTVRLISGDNLSTTSAVAVDTGILTNEEFQSVGSGHTGIAMDASEFRQICGDVITRENEVEEGNEPTFTYSLSQNNQQQFDRIIETLKVIGRAEPQDKLRLVAGLKGMRSGMDDDDTPLRRVAVVGEGINDIDAFKAADVSFAVQDGTSMARNNASMILQTNDFDSCMRAVMWGRNIYMNVQRFLQFQITCTLTVLIVVMVSYITMTESVLNPVQLIWINLIMDVLGALALASTRPNTDIASYQAGQGNIMTPQMYRQIFGMMVFMTTIMMIVMYMGKNIFDLDYKTSDQTTENKDKQAHFTLIWNTFIFMQVFNLINCRDVGANKMHGFTGLIRNRLTWFVLLIIIGVQIASCLTFLGVPIFEACAVSGRHFAITIVAASSMLLANSILKFIPNRWIEKLPTVDESKAIGGGSALMGAYDKQAKAKAYTGKQVAAQEAVPMDDDEEDSYKQA